jgi:hypothetical protein
MKRPIVRSLARPLVRRLVWPLALPTMTNKVIIKIVFKDQIVPAVQQSLGMENKDT